MERLKDGRLENPETFSPRLEMTGPFRHEDGSVDVIGSDGRLSGRTATLQLPFHALRSPLRIWVRSQLTVVKLALPALLRQS